MEDTKTLGTWLTAGGLTETISHWLPPANWVGELLRLPIGGGGGVAWLLFLGVSLPAAIGAVKLADWLYYQGFLGGTGGIGREADPCRLEGVRRERELATGSHVPKRVADAVPDFRFPFAGDTGGFGFSLDDVCSDVGEWEWGSRRGGSSIPAFHGGTSDLERCGAIAFSPV